MFALGCGGGLCIGALARAAQGIRPLPTILRGVSGVLLPIFIILSILGLLIWSPFWNALAPFGVIEKDVRRPAITATIALGLIGCGLLILRSFFGWIRRFSRRYEHAGVAVGVGPLYFLFPPAEVW